MKYDVLNTVATVCEWRRCDFECRARELHEVLENKQFCTEDQEFFRPIHDPWARTYMVKLAELYQEMADMLGDLAVEADRVALED